MTDALDKAIADALGKPRRLGIDDCGIWIADIIRDTTGIDVAHDMRERYCSEIERNRMIKSRWGTMLWMLDSMLARAGFVRLRGLPAYRGAVGLAGDGAICISTGDGYWVTRAEVGVAFLQQEAVSHWWNRPGRTFDGN